VAEPAGEPLVSVIVPTKDRPEQLASCLEALEHQTAAAVTEVIVVDDGSTDAAAIEYVSARRPRLRVLRQPAAGPAAARNRGIRSARGRYVCFTDDDCEPRPEWVERLIGPLRGGAAAAAGLTLNGLPQNPFAEASELVGAALSTPAPDGQGGIAFARSNNLACRREVLATISFDEAFSAAAGEDRDWSARLLAAGHLLASEPEAVVVHRHLLRFGDFWNQQLRYGRGAYRFRAVGGSRPLEPFSFYARLVGRAFRRDARVGLLVVVAQIATAVGFLAEWKASLAFRVLSGRSRRPAPHEVLPHSGRDRRQTDKMVDDVEWESSD
jgi:glycosyltransferase involved in cell wall biosynthesis